MFYNYAFPINFPGINQGFLNNKLLYAQRLPGISI